METYFWKPRFCGFFFFSKLICLYLGLYYWEILYLVGGLNPSETYESQLGGLFPTHGKIKNVPNHQPVITLW
jgi:hypothetical protein